MSVRRESDPTGTCVSRATTVQDQLGNRPKSDMGYSPLEKSDQGNLLSYSNSRIPYLDE